MGIDIATDRSWSTATFDHEPRMTALTAETSWMVDGLPVDGFRLSAFETETGIVTWEELHHAPREFILSFDSRDQLARLFLDAVDHGEAGYAKLWGGRLAFPTRAVRALRTALEVPSLPALNYEA